MSLNKFTLSYHCFPGAQGRYVQAGSSEDMYASSSKTWGLGDGLLHSVFPGLWVQV